MDGDGQVLERFRYDVFLSFHGKDTRMKFTGHLYKALSDSGINTFRDDKKLPKGGVISSELSEAIKSSKVLVIVFSKNYASSTWCLDELLHIMKCSKLNSQQLVFPIFLDIDPSDIRRQKGTVAESFVKHKSRFRSDELQSWKDALTAAANLSGWDLRGRHETEGIDEVVREILRKLKSSYLHIASHPVGLTPRLHDLYSLLSMDSDDVQVIGICGMGGIGKTTIAKAAYNECSHLFEIKIFLENFREFSKKPGGKNQLWQQGYSNIGNRHDNNAQKGLHKKSVLLVIDDVKNFAQFNYEAIDRDQFGQGSRIIVTSRDRHLLEQLGANTIFVPQKLENDESLELLSWHAFRAYEPPNEFLVLSRDVIEYCEGLPLAIQVLGASLFRRGTQQWKDTLNLLERIPNGNIQEKLQISFNVLSEEEREIFLDIACFFVGMDKDYVRDILDGCGFSSDLGLGVLEEKCLVTSYDNKLMMHGLIRKMGREIVRKEFPNNFGKRSRLWGADDVTDVLINCSGTDAVEGLSLKAHGLDIGKLDTKSFSKLQGLRFLQLSHIQLSGSYEEFPKGLKSLCWHGFASKFIPKNLCLRKLAFMDMRFSKLVQLWEEPMAQSLKKLKFLDLSFSLGLRETPDFSFLPNLEKLLLAGCKSLVLVHESIGILCEKLVLVNLRDCTELADLPASFYELKSLEILNISGCSKLKKMDDALGKMEALQTLHADCMVVSEIPSLTVRLKNLEKLSLAGSYGPIPMNLRGDKVQILEGGCHGVFLSYHRKDACKNFVDGLYHALRNSGIHAFRDDEEQPRKFMGSELQEAIESSKILIVVFSKNYVSATRCLDELQHIMKCSKRNLQQIVFPVFHNIEPLDIQKHKGTVAELFAQHESYFPLEKVQSWRDALTAAAANLSGLDLRNRHEADCIEDIINEILKMLDGFYLHVACHPVGIRSRVREFYPLLNAGSEDIRVVGIWGMGGLGKTTLAKAIYNEFSHAFEGRSFLPNFKELSRNSEGRNYLSQKLLFDILKRHDIENRAMEVILRQKRVLVVVDEVDDFNQFNHVFKDLNWFGPGSRIILTTRDRHLLMMLGAKYVYELSCLHRDGSLELFSRYAFRKNEPPEDFLWLSVSLVECCRGLPLAITVCGAFLFERSLLEWDQTLELLQRGLPHEPLMALLRMVFGALCSDQKHIFLDIAIFFNGMEKDYVRYILDGCGFSPDIGLSVLMERCLVTIYDDKLMMHDLIQEMGREIVREKSPMNCAEQSRLWCTDEVVAVLTEYLGTEAVEGLSLKAQSLDVGILDARSFSTLQELRLLQLSHVQLEGSYEHFPKGLKWLYWHGFPLEFIPANFYLRSLAVMDMQHSNLRRLWKVSEAQHLEKLKFLDLSYSLLLWETPDFSYLPNLEKLLLTGCKSLVLVHESINILSEKLVLLNLRDCIELEDLPANFYKLKSLETLVILGCSKLKRLDDALQQMEALTTLLADDSAIKETTSQLSCLFPASVEGSTSCLKTLCLSYCNLRDEAIPKDLRSLPCLEEIDLRGNNFHNLQVDFSGLQNLGLLRLDNCSKLQTILCLPGSLKDFYATDCVSLERTPDVSGCLSLQSLHLTNCKSLVETPGLVNLKAVRLICMERCYRMADTFKDSILQAVSGYGGIFLPGSRLPNWFNSFKPHQQRLISFTVPETPNRDLAGFTLCMCYSSRLENVRSECITNIKVRNHTKGGPWRSLLTVNILMCREGHLWQGDLTTEDLPFEAGDRLEVFVNLGDRVTLLEIGVAFGYREKEGYPKPGQKATIGYADASDKSGIISIEEDSADEIQVEIQSRETKDESEVSVKPGIFSIEEVSADEIQDEIQLTEAEDDPEVSGNFHEEAGEGEMAYIKEGGDFSESMDNETTKDIFTVIEQNSAPEVPRYQEQSPQADNESRRRPLRKMRPVLRTFLGALGFFTFAVAWQILVNRGGAASLLNRIRIKLRAIKNKRWFNR